MSKNIIGYFKEHKNKDFLAIFPHPDDAAFVAGGLFQLLQKLDIKTKLICLTSEKSKEQLMASGKLLGIDDMEVYDYKPGSLKEKKSLWLEKIQKEINKTKPFAVLTFDPHGITGNADHIEASIGVFNLLRDINGKKPVLLWRVSDSQERNYFDKKSEVSLNIEPTFYHFLRVSESIKKLSAIFSFKNKFKKLTFKMRILEWYLFDHKELYYLVDFSNNKYQIVVN